MNILLIAPEPFYEERGTPIAVKLLLETLCEAGHDIELLTYHEGANIEIKGLRTIRIPRLPLIKNIPIGLSWKKLVCDFFLSLKMFHLARRKRYQVVHAVEESIFPALVVKYFLKNKLIYDMDSSMPEQLAEKWPFLKVFISALYAFEGMAIRRSDLVLVVCQYLADKAYVHAPDKKIFVIEDIPLASEDSFNDVEETRSALGIDGIMVLYVGNLERYQGIDLMLEGMAVLDENNNVHLVIVGGNDRDIMHYRAMSEKLGIAGYCHFLGPRPISRLSGYLRQADILVSPRIKGGNTPMKIYSYLASGKPILATDIESHTQVLDTSCAMLVRPVAEDIASGLRALAVDPELRRDLGLAGRQLAELKYSRQAYKRKVLDAYSALEVGV